MSDDSRVIVMNPPSHPLAVYVDGYAEQVDAPEFVLDDVIAAGTVVMAGERGLGKTSAIVPLVISCTQLLNGFPLRATIRRKVIYIAEDVAQVQRIISAMRHDGLIAADREEFNQWFLLVEAKRLSATDIAKVVPHYDDLWTPNQRIDGSIYMAPPVVVMDTSNATIDLDNISDNSEVSAAVATLRQSFGHICLILIGHVSKASRTDAKLVSFIGAGAWEGDTQQTLYLVCDGEERYLVIGKRRFEPDASEYRIISHVSTFDAKDKLGHTVEIKCFYGTPEATSSEEKEQVKAQRQAEQKAATWTAVQNRVLDYVKVNAGASKRDISETVTGKATTIRAAVEELVSRGELKTEEKNGTIHHYPVFGTQRDTAGHGGTQTHLKPTCHEEAEALKDAPPWHGMWVDKPTIKQRIMLWLDWAQLGGDKMKRTDPFYSSTRWKALRLQVLRRDNYTCCDCGCKALGRNRNGVSPHVDHDQPRSKRPDLEWDAGNLVVRCHSCHNTKTKSEQSNKPLIGTDGYPVDWGDG